MSDKSNNGEFEVLFKFIPYEIYVKSSLEILNYYSF